jgi:hypothetical protein
MTRSQTVKDGRPSVRTALESVRLRDRLSIGLFRGQLGPSREDDWRNFAPRR